MKEDDKKIFAFFDQKTETFPQKALLGLSGGADSLSLFYLLLAYSKRFPKKLSFGAAHIDHSWREESEKEKEQLELLAQNHSIPFYSCKLTGEPFEGNKEEACRKLRLQFFKDIYSKENFSALVLGHHADDQAETIFKRFCEGSHLCSLAAMQPCSQLEGMTVWRPLLLWRKATIIEWLRKQKKEAFDDPTNYDTTYLRSRLRYDILPALSARFGKDICNPICRIGEEAQELKDYLEGILKPLVSLEKAGPFGSYYDLSKIALSPFILRHLIRRLCSRHLKATLSRDSLHSAIAAVIEGKANCRIGGEELPQFIVDRSHLFFIHHIPLSGADSPLLLTEGVREYGSWEIAVASASERHPMAAPSWRELWSGRFASAIAYKEEPLYFLPLSKMEGEGKKNIARRLGEAKVPLFLRSWLPLLCSKNHWEVEFLTGKEERTERKVTGKEKVYFLQFCIKHIENQ